MARHGRLFLKIPHLYEDDEKLVGPVDLERIRPDHFSQLFYLDGGHYKPAFGAEAALPTGIDVGKLEKELADLRADAQNQLAGFAEVGGGLFSELLGDLAWQDLIHAIALGQIDVARNILRAMLQSLTATGLRVSAELYHQDRTVKAATEMTESLSLQKDQSDDIALQQMDTWGRAAQDLLDLCEQIQKIEDELQLLHGTVVAKKHEFAQYVSEANPILRVPQSF